MNKGVLVQAILDRVSGGENSPEITIKAVDIKAILPVLISTAERLADIEDVKSYRFDRVSFVVKNSPTLPTELLILDEDDNGVFVNLNFSNRDGAKLQAWIGRHLIPILDNAFELQMISTSRKGYKSIEDKVKKLRFEGLIKGASVKVMYEHDFSDLADSDVLPYSDVTIGKTIELTTRWFLESRLTPQDSFNNNIDEVNRMK